MSKEHLDECTRCLSDYLHDKYFRRFRGSALYADFLAQGAGNVSLDNVVVLLASFRNDR
jgi:hypothetical protein